MDNKSDSRVADWFLMSSPLPTIAICLTYVYAVKVSTSEVSCGSFDTKSILP
jgi:hypothetical protein